MQTRTKKRLSISLIIGAAVIATAVFFILRSSDLRILSRESDSESISEQDLPADFEEESQSDLDDPSLTPAEREERLAQIKRMHKDLPGNIFLPPLSTSEGEKALAERNILLKKMRELEIKITKHEENDQEKAEFIRLKSRYLDDKIAMLQYLAIKDPSGKIPEHIQEMIEEMRSEKKSLEKESR